MADRRQGAASSATGGARRDYAATLVAGLAGAAAVAVAVTRPWLRAEATVPGLPPIEATVSGASLSPLAGALGVVLLASFGAVIATRGWVRRALGMVIVLAAAVVIASAVAVPEATEAVEDGLSARGWAQGDYGTSTVAWRWLALTGAVLALLAGVAVLARGHRWPVLGSRYDAPAPGTARESRTEPDGTLDDEDVWRALDRGHDPTRDG